MERRTLTFCCAAVLALALLCSGRAFASDDTPSPTPAKSGASVKSHGRPAKRPRRTAQPAKVEDKKAAAAKAQPWADVDPDRAVRPPDPTQPGADAKPTAPTAKWAKDSFDFGTKVTGSNDFRQLPRFDINENPQGLGAETGINLHF